MPYEDMGAMRHRLELEGRERLVVSGVEEVERFDEEEIVMATTAGTLVVGGTGLHIGKLNLEGGELHVDGTIHTLLYEESGGSREGGLLRRLFG
ncbi:MAG: sporulation protein YabP [Oscillibacter sp.]|nr:sporulation protein YabP [Oscillibacter sp.]